MGEEADWLIDNMIFGNDEFDEYGEYTGKRIEYVQRTATEVAEQLLKDRNHMKNVDKLNEGVIKF